MALHFLLTENNNSWGVKTDSGGNPVYEHIVDFKKQALKDDFIKNELFNGKENWVEILKSQPAKGDRIFNDNNVSFSVNVKTEYPDLDYVQVLNKNYCAIWDDITDKITFWAVSGSTNENHNIVNFEGIRDWMFDLSVTRIFDSKKQVVIERSHIDDVKDNLWNISQSSENSIVEAIEEFDSGCYYPTTNKELGITDYTSKMDDSIIDKNVTNQIINNGWLIAYITLQQESGIKGKLYFTDKAGLKWILNAPDITSPSYYYPRVGIDKHRLPYLTLVLSNNTNIRIDGNAATDLDITYVTVLVTSSPNTVNVSVLPYAPFALDDVVKISQINKKIVIQLTEKVNNDNSKVSAVILRPDISGALDKFGAAFINNIPAWDLTTGNTSLNQSNYDKDVNRPFILENVGKLHKNPYKLDFLKGISGASLLIYPQNLENNFNLSMSFTYAVDAWHLITKINDLDNPNGFYNQQFIYGLRLDDINPWTYPIETTAYGEYIIRNRDQVNQRFRTMGWNVAGAVISGATGISTGGIGLADDVSGHRNANNGIPEFITRGERGRFQKGDINAFKKQANLVSKNVLSGSALASKATGFVGSSVLGGIVSGAQAINAIRQQKAMLRDLKQQPSSVSGNGGDIMGVMSKTSLTPYLYSEELWPELKRSVGWYFHMYGSKLNQVARNINAYLDRRYHFNYIETQDLFQNFLPQINNGAKALINNSFQNGVWIWHYRDKKTWKGVKNFDVNNVQLSVLPPQATIEVNETKIDLTIDYEGEK